jgi:hypothetical protein
MALTRSEDPRKNKPGFAEEAGQGPGAGKGLTGVLTPLAEYQLATGAVRFLDELAPEQTPDTSER